MERHGIIETLAHNVNYLEKRVAKLEEEVEKNNSTISSLINAVITLQNREIDRNKRNITGDNGEK